MDSFSETTLNSGRVSTESNVFEHEMDKLRNLTEQCHSARPKAEHIRRLNGYWQVFQRRRVYISMYSAFFDTRSIRNDRTPFVYINAVARQLSERRKDEEIGSPVRSSYYCHLWYDGQTHPAVVVMTFIRNEFLRSIDGRAYSTYTLACPLELGLSEVPTHVSIAYSRCGPVRTYLPVTDTRQDVEQHEFGICTAVGFGRLAAERMVEWFEFHRLLGVTEFNIYDVSMRGLKRVFDHYRQAGVLRVHAITSPVSSRYVASIRLASQVVLNDCVLRNRLRYKYVISVDFDEIMWPNRAANFSSLIGAVNALQRVRLPCVSYTLQNAYHLLSYPEDVSQPWFLRTMRFRYRQQPTPKLAKSKSIIDPKMCIIVYHHACIVRVDPELAPTVVVDPELAVSHHYRECPPGNVTACDVIPSDPDDRVLRYKDQLFSRVQPVLRKVGLL